MTPRVTFLWLGAWLALTAPLLTLGYGSDVDAWTLSRTAEIIWDTGTYLRSRSAGFPLHELALAPLVTAGGWLASNSFSLAAGIALFALLVKLGRHGALRHPALTLVTLMFLPAIVKNSTSTMDYVPALAVLTGAYLAWHTQRYLLGAALVGIACGFRPTSALFVIPIAAATYVQSRNIRLVATMAAIAGAAGLFVLWPSLRLGAVPMPRDVPFLQGIASGLELLGIAQTPLLVLLMAQARRAAPVSIRSRPFDVFHATNIAIFTIAFLLHPGGAEYLLPATWSIVLVLDRYATRRGMIAACVVALSYHVMAVDVTGTRGGLRPVGLAVTPGYTITDIAHRRFTLWFRDAVASWPGTQPTVILEYTMHPFAADRAWTYDAALNIFRHAGSEMAVGRMMTDPVELQRLRDAGFRVVVWRERAWRYARPPADAARPLIEFVDDLGAVLGTPMRGYPLE